MSLTLSQPNIDDITYKLLGEYQHYKIADKDFATIKARKYRNKKVNRCSVDFFISICQLALMCY